MLTVKDFEIREDPFCECCGPMEDGTPTYFDGGTFWCVDCKRANDEVSDEEYQKVWALSRDWTPPPIKMYVWSWCEYEESEESWVFAYNEQEAYDHLFDGLYKLGKNKKEAEKTVREMKRREYKQGRRFWVLTVHDVKPGMVGV